MAGEGGWELPVDKKGECTEKGWEPLCYRHQTEYIEDSSWLRVQDREIFSKRGLKYRATNERGFQEHARKRLPHLREVNMMNPISFFVEDDLF